MPSTPAGRCSRKAHRCRSPPTACGFRSAGRSMTPMAGCTASVGWRSSLCEEAGMHVDTALHRLTARLEALKAELAVGDRRLRALDIERQSLRDAMLRIEGAIAVLEELITAMPAATEKG